MSQYIASPEARPTPAAGYLDIRANDELTDAIRYVQMLYEPRWGHVFRGRRVLLRTPASVRRGLVSDLDERRVRHTAGMTETAERESPQCGEDILEALASNAAAGLGGLTVTGLAAVIGRDRGVTARVVEDLVDLGLVDRIGVRGRVQLGWGLFASAAQIVQVRLETHSQEVLERLADACQEAAWVVVRRGAEAVSVAEAAPELAVQWVSWIGRGFPVARSDAGPALLQDLDRAQLRALLGGGRLPSTAASRAPGTLEGLAALIRDARERGVCVLDEQAEADVASVAAPVRDFRGVIVAAVVVSGPAVRLRDRLDGTAELVRSAANEFSRNLGARV